MSRVTETVLALAKPVAEAQGCEVWDVEYVREAGAWYLRVYIDKPGGVSIDDCEAVSRALDPVLDEADPDELCVRGILCRGGAGAQAPLGL